MHPCAHSWLGGESIAGSNFAVPDRLIVFCPTHASLPPCSPPSKVRPREVGHCGVVCATADLDGVCARRRSKSARSGRRNGCRIEQRNRQDCKHLSCQLFMVTIREGDSGRPSRSVLNNPGSSPQLPCSGLRHGGLRRSDQLADGLLADAQPVRDRPVAHSLALQHLNAAQTFPEMRRRPRRQPSSRSSAAIPPCA